jgi:hypothetical protein
MKEFIFSFVFFLLFLLSGFDLGAAQQYVVTAKRVSDQPIFSSQIPGKSIFTYNYNTAYLPLPGVRKMI